MVGAKIPLLNNAHPDIARELSFFAVENDQPRKFTRGQIDTFNERGFIFPLDVFTTEEATANRSYFDSLMAAAASSGHQAYSINGWHTCCQGIYDLVIDNRILDYVQDLLGEDLICWGTHYFNKLPGDKKQVIWHQDASYWPLTPSKTVTVWLAIDDADVENGAMQVIPGSHRHGQIDYEASTDEDKNVLNQSVRNPLQYGEAPVSFEMQAGQISLHTDLLLHGSEPNCSQRRRCGLTIRYCPPDVRALKGWNKNGVVCRGRDWTGHWANHPCPDGEQIPGPKPK